MPDDIKRSAGLRVPEPKLRPKLLPMWGCPVPGCSSMSPKKQLVEQHIEKHHSKKPKDD